MSRARVPLQARSRATVERILQAAEEEIGDHGLANASTTSIAARAGVSVGAVYRFFADKDEIARAMGQRYLEAVQADFTRLVDAVDGPRTFQAAVVGLVEVASAAQLRHPGYYRLTEDSGPECDESPAHAVREQLIDLFVAKVVDGSDEPREDLRLVVELCIETVRNTLARAPREPRARARAVRELQTMLSAYLRERFGG
ncbi:MAG: TetR/AcrR family transcriptional regulator [Nocardioides sp.]|uniref:TetR/AcrR family transcriptional regulator n=1 Tax=Nocardioides sp. TaxID=35761 RepID=UPI003F106C3E